MLDVIIVGAGPAGLSAALILGRCLRSVLVCDSGRQRNAYSHALHAFITREGTPPLEFLAIARSEIQQYSTVRFIDLEVRSAKKIKDGFEVSLSNGENYQAKKLLLASGVVDEIPKIEGIGSLFGKSVFNCPYCDGWEVRDKALAVYGQGQRGVKLAHSLRVWSKDLMLFTDGPSDLEAKDLESLKRHGIILREEKILRLEGVEGKLKFIHLENAGKISRDSLFFNTPSYIRSKLLDQLECRFDEVEGIATDKYERTEVPGLYVAGNMLRDVQLVIVAAAQGAEAAFGINTALTKESFPH